MLTGRLHVLIRAATLSEHNLIHANVPQKLKIHANVPLSKIDNFKIHVNVPLSKIYNVKFYKGSNHEAFILRDEDSL